MVRSLWFADRSGDVNISRERSTIMKRPEKKKKTNRRRRMPIEGRTCGRQMILDIGTRDAYRHAFVSDAMHGMHLKIERYNINLSMNIR